jgi:hypothetical protein
MLDMKEFSCKAARGQAVTAAMACLFGYLALNTFRNVGAFGGHVIALFKGKWVASFG